MNDYFHPCNVKFNDQEEEPQLTCLNPTWEFLRENI